MFCWVFFLGKYEISDLLNLHAGLGRRHFVLSGQSYQLLATAVTAINNLNDLNDKNQQSLKELTGHSKPKEVNKREWTILFTCGPGIYLL
jgi:hypothetical protein